MLLLENVPLSNYSTMRLGGKARYVVEITDRNQIVEAVTWAEANQKPVIMVGVGSNIIWKDEGFEGLLLVNKIPGFETQTPDEENLYVTIGAGEDWDSVVARLVGMGFSGVEELSLIPGTAGSTPIQNVGAYGREIKDVLVSVEAYDIHERKLVTIAGPDCSFGYRNSRFNTTDRNRFLITSVTLPLTKTTPAPPFYQSLQSYFTEHQITQFTPQIVRDAVIAIRSAKLPDPSAVANNGSFFANPFINEDQLHLLLADYPGLVYWRTDDNQVKVSAAWLVEQAGFKDFHDPETGMATWAKQPLVFVNEKARTTADLLRFRQKVMDAVEVKFGITLQQEPELLP
jgi:UDP-N-acetylmuramate dehydrogenase